MPFPDELAESDNTRLCKWRPWALLSRYADDRKQRDRPNSVNRSPYRQTQHRAPALAPNSVSIPLRRSRYFSTLASLICS